MNTPTQQELAFATSIAMDLVGAKLLDLDADWATMLSYAAAAAGDEGSYTYLRDVWNDDVNGWRIDLDGERASARRVAARLGFSEILYAAGMLIDTETAPSALRIAEIGEVAGPRTPWHAVLSLALDDAVGRYLGRTEKEAAQ